MRLPPPSLLPFDDWFDAIEAGVRARVRGFIETMLEEKTLRHAVASGLTGGANRTAARRRRPAWPPQARTDRSGTFGRTEISVPARLTGASAGGKAGEWKGASLRTYQRRTRGANALIAGAYLSRTNTRRIRRALASAFAGPVGKDVLSRTWRKVKGDWDAWNAWPRGEESIVRLFLDGTVVRVRPDRRVASISLLVAHGLGGMDGS